MTDEPQPQDSPDNVDAPLPGDRGARGRFDLVARSFSTQVLVRDHPLATAAGALVLVTGAAAGWRAAR